MMVISKILLKDLKMKKIERYFNESKKNNRGENNLDVN